ncbi:hypothetical protein HPP92_018208 [Vanilla planifolia]|uniref:L-2-hydroxyglutarate dehydrogenase, mitochondrial n=1 Tax=Vanilla planifolia TaxID=51239 RepID=A0A835UM74_VANPL|nr:hypothetical protein HPP92_018208 [Vanilla planifolia]
MPRETADVVVIGAGVVGLTVAREFALRGRDVLVLEASSTFGTGTSSRNSEVIHAGIYYPFRSLKAILCVRGRDLLYKYCSDRGIPHKQLGKLIVATGVAEIPKLEEIQRRGVVNGVENLRMLEGYQAMEMEPELWCVKGLLSPSSGIIDSHSFMLSLVGEAENSGATFSYNTTVISGQFDGASMRLHISESRELENNKGLPDLQPQLILIPKIVINSAGLSAISLVKRFEGLDSRFIPASYFARGCYFNLSKAKAPFSCLVYPMPEDGGIGVHVTLDLNGQVKFGPDVEWLNDVDDTSCFLNKFDYSVNPDRSSRFYPEIRKYFPDLRDGSLEPGYSGIRPKLSGPGQLPSDFVIQGEEVHGIPGLVNLFGIESPGLTSSLAIAEFVASKFSRSA